MKRVIYADSLLIGGRNLPINTTKKSGCFFEILKAIHSQMEAMLTYYSRILIVPIDLHLHEFTPGNERVSAFIRKAKKLIERKYKKYNMEKIGHVWVREKAKAASQHYHAVFILNGNAVRKAHPIQNICEYIWEGWGQPHPYRPDRTYTIHRDDEEAFATAFRHLSYYAKEATKGDRSMTANDYSTSRIKPKA